MTFLYEEINKLHMRCVRRREKLRNFIFFSPRTRKKHTFRNPQSSPRLPLPADHIYRRFFAQSSLKIRSSPGSKLRAKYIFQSLSFSLQHSQYCFRIHHHLGYSIIIPDSSLIPQDLHIMVGFSPLYRPAHLIDNDAFDDLFFFFFFKCLRYQICSLSTNIRGEKIFIRMVCRVQVYYVLTGAFRNFLIG